VTAAPRARRLVFARAAEFLSAYVLAIWVVYAHLLHRQVGGGFLPLAAAFTFVQSVAIGLLVAVIVGRTVVSECVARRVRRLQPAILDALAEHAAGADRSSELRRFARLHPFQVESCLADLLPTVSGAARGALSRLAVDIGLVGKWKRDSRSRNVVKRRAALAAIAYLSIEDARALLVRAVDDPDPEIRLEAACAVLRQRADRTLVERVFELAAHGTILERTILGEELRPHAPLLCDRAIPEYLQCKDRDRVLIALELMQVWGRAVPAPHVFALLHDDDAAIRSAALRVLPVVVSDGDLGLEILARLSDPHPGVRAAAAYAGGRLLDETADGALAVCLYDSHSEVARAAGFALAELGPTGIDTLERQAASADGAVAATAREALERVRIGRCDYARS
jgi:HEAT repeat protein